MFEFENLGVYHNAEDYCIEIRSFLRAKRELARFEKDQLGRAALSIAANIAEGNGLHSNKTKINYFRISLASLAETVAIIRILSKEKLMSEKEYSSFYKKAEVCLHYSPILNEPLGMASAQVVLPRRVEYFLIDAGLLDHSQTLDCNLALRICTGGSP